MATKLEKIHIKVIVGTVLGVGMYRGFGRLCDLARMSQADIYDPKTNKTGTQRDLSPKHAKDAYEYVRTHDLAYWPEIFLNARDAKAISFAAHAHAPGLGTLTINMREIQASVKRGRIAISRVDGNHRLHYADGETSGFDPIEKLVSFCLAHNLTVDHEIALFRDINNNQKRMNTSHLDNIETRLSPEQKLKRENAPLYIAQRLGSDADSPFHGRIYDGGKKTGSLIPLRTLRTGIEYMFSRATKLTALPDPDARYKVIRNYFSAAKKWVPEAWAEPQKYLMLRGAGLWGICFLGAEVADRVLAKGEYEVESMVAVLKSGKSWDWSSDGDFGGLSGRGGAVKIAEKIVAELSDESGMSMKELYRKIMKEP